MGELGNGDPRKVSRSKHQYIYALLLDDDDGLPSGSLGSGMMTTGQVGTLGFADAVGIFEATYRPVEVWSSKLSRLEEGCSRSFELK